jgi:hypothetical protein
VRRRRHRRQLPAPGPSRTPHCSALLPPRVCRSLQSGVATELTDGFAFGVTVLMTLTGLPAAEIKQRCRHMLRWPTQPQRWQPPGVPDVAAGSWDDGTSIGLAEIIQGLDEKWAEERMPLPDVLARLEAMVVAATASSSEAEAAVAADARVCIICEEAPREVRFACGHALVCNGCLPAIVEQCKKCPTCDRPFGAQPVAERGTHVRVAPTFVLPK